MTPEDTQTLLEVAQWVQTHRKVRSAIRQLAKTEENYLLVIRELERVESQCFRAHTLRAEATLTLVEWLETLNYFHWRCAYCQSKPCQVMSHYIALPEGGTTAANCIPACYRCRRFRPKEDERIRAYLAQVRTRKQRLAVVSPSL
jgi:5-methylcytosine-specific restriction endonuclease McrA